MESDRKNVIVEDWQSLVNKPGYLAMEKRHWNC